MHTYLRPGLQILVSSLFIAIVYNHFIRDLNPFLSLVFSSLLGLGVGAQLIVLRKFDLVYSIVFLLCLITLTAVLMHYDNEIFNGPARYYGHN
ncbi:hypothetical protein [Spirosoma rigui]|uniref:hypothetical protein n=1 Tax=Spirosoma rigui TaxID=564064 RepID=UPI0009B139A3|nr:hypothetical protein [Spirosoma rigui]